MNVPNFSALLRDGPKLFCELAHAADVGNDPKAINLLVAELRRLGARPQPETDDHRLALKLLARDGNFDEWPGGSGWGSRTHGSIRWSLREGSS